jgi:hypothetical protein
VVKPQDAITKTACSADVTSPRANAVLVVIPASIY